MTTVNLALSIQVVGGPQLAVSTTKSVEAYDKTEVVIDPGGASAVEKLVYIQPGSAAQVSLLLIKSDLYGPEITYKASDGTTDSDAITLDEPQVMLGSGSVSLLGVAPKILKFKNTHPAGDAGKKATIEILVGRDATP